MNVYSPYNVKGGLMNGQGVSTWYTGIIPYRDHLHGYLTVSSCRQVTYSTSRQVTVHPTTSLMGHSQYDNVTRSWDSVACH